MRFFLPPAAKARPRRHALLLRRLLGLRRGVATALLVLVLVAGTATRRRPASVDDAVRGAPTAWEEREEAAGEAFWAPPATASATARAEPREPEAPAAPAVALAVEEEENDPQCRISLPSFEQEPYKAAVVAVAGKAGKPRKDQFEEFAVGPCRYLYPARTPPVAGYTGDIDWYYDREVEDGVARRREACFVRCLARMDAAGVASTDEMLAAAAAMGLEGATRALVAAGRDPLWRPPPDSGGLSRFRPNAVQAALAGGHAEVVRLLTAADPARPIDPEGRTAADYVRMKGSPIRPHYAREVLGIEVPDPAPAAGAAEEEEDGGGDKRRDECVDDPAFRYEGQSGKGCAYVAATQKCDKVPRGLDEPLGVSACPTSCSMVADCRRRAAAGRPGWNATAQDGHVDPSCDFDVLDSRADVSLDVFLRDYYLPGRPVVLRDHVSRLELASFSKKAWSRLEHFHPESRHRVGATAYPSLSGQDWCSHDMAIEELENDGRCQDPGWAQTRVMHAEHREHFDEAYAIYHGDPTVPEGGFRKLREYFHRDFQAHGWQIFYGADGSGATLHWHAAAFNILYVGKKEWRVTPPRHRGFTGLTAQAVRDNIRDKPFTQRCLQLPGDLIYIPDHWGHSTINHGFGIGVAAIVKQVGRFLPGHVGKFNDKQTWHDEGGGAQPRGAGKPHRAPPRRHEADPRHGPPPEVPVGDGTVPRDRRGGNTPTADHRSAVAARPGRGPPPVGDGEVPRDRQGGNTPTADHRSAVAAHPRRGPPPVGDGEVPRDRRERNVPSADQRRAVGHRPPRDGGGRRQRGGRRERGEHDIPFFFVHINKTGGTSLIRMLGEHCSADEYVQERWETAAGLKHRSFHSTAHSYIARHGREAWDRAYSFAVVRHPLARQVSNFFFLAANCAEDERRCGGERMIPRGLGSDAEATEEEKVAAFHAWMEQLYRAYPPGSPGHHLLGSKGHGNEEYPTMDGTQTSWLVDETGRDIVVKEVFRLESLSGDMAGLMKAIPCLARAPQQTLISKNLTPSYPHYSKFAHNERTNHIMQEVFAVDYANFGYDLV